ncbi:MAG: hypothetical protein MI920_07810 [Kiloniellales bacterium]|nr:hypothetical protein [Kiloniellales bacterium]
MGGVKRASEREQDRQQRATALGELREAGIDVFCWCNRCGHNAVMAIATLAERLGDDWPVPEVGAQLRCSDCGSKDVATRPAWPGLGQVARHD